MQSPSLSSKQFLNLAMILAILLAALLPSGMGARPALALSPDLVISQVYGGGGNTGAPYRNDFVEIFNRGQATVTLTGKSIQYASATGTGNFGGNPIVQLSGSLAPGQYYLVQLSGGSNGVPLPIPDATGTIAMGASAGKVILANSSSGIACNGGSTPCSPEQLALIIDLVGWGNANFFETSVAPAPSNTTSILRKSNGCVETDNNGNDFFADNPLPRNSASPFNVCAFDTAPAVASTYPADGATDFVLDANLNVTFSEPVNVSAPWYSLSCSVSGAVSSAYSGGPVSFTIDPAVDFVDGETCTLEIFAAQVADQDTNDPPDEMEANYLVNFSPANVCSLAYLPAYSIQGSGATAAITGPVTTQGVVVGDFELPSGSGQIRGFYLQDLSGDGDPATSDGIFVFTGGNNRVSLGDVVRVSGTASEFQEQTQVSASTITSCGTGSVAPVDVTLPVPSADYLERYEGMLVRLPQTLYVTEHFQLGRFGQVVVSSGERLKQPTNVVLPGAPALALQAANNLNRIIIDDNNNVQNPDPILFGRDGMPLSASNTLRGGDTATGIVGVMNYNWAGNSASGNAYRVRPIGSLNGFVNFEAANLRPLGGPTPSGSLRVAGMNLLNFFNTFDGFPDTVDNCTLGVGGAPTDCRGADDQLELDRQVPKTVAAILGSQADVIGVVEIENDGYGPDSALQYLVDQLNANSAPGTYAFIDVDAATGQLNALGTDAIKVGLIYKPARVSPVGMTAALNSVEFVNGGDGEARNRPALAQAFEQTNGARFVVVVNHLKSKGSACDLPDAGDGQGECNLVRTNAANLMAQWLASDPTGTGDPDTLIIGDLNSYAMEDPITALKNAGYTNLIYQFAGGNEAYSYVFDGQWGYLDHALASPNLVGQVTGVADWHINADEPSVLDYNTNFKSAGQLISLYAPDEFRISDHDPVLVDLNLNDPPTVDAGGPYQVPEGGSVMVSAMGSDPNGDPLSYAWDLDNDGIFETPGQTAVFSAASLFAPASYTIKVQVTDPGGLSAIDEATVYVIYNFFGFFPPVDNLPFFNTVNSGRAIPIKFSLGGFKGMDILAAGYPMYEFIACGSDVLVNGTHPAMNPGGSSLSYDPASDQYNFVWKTEKSMKNTCVQFVLLLNDGTYHRANFTFNK